GAPRVRSVELRNVWRRPRRVRARPFRLSSRRNPPEFSETWAAWFSSLSGCPDIRCRGVLPAVDFLAVNLAPFDHRFNRGLEKSLRDERRHERAEDDDG